MREFILELDYGTKIIKNLNSTWIQPMMMSPGWMLCYKDDVYDRGIIYRSENKKVLVEIQSKMINAYQEGKSKVRL